MCSKHAYARCGCYLLFLRIRRLSTGKMFVQFVHWTPQKACGRLDKDSKESSLAVGKGHQFGFVESLKSRNCTLLRAWLLMSDDGESPSAVEIVRLFGVFFLLFMLVLSKLVQQLKGLDTRPNSLCQMNEPSVGALCLLHRGTRREHVSNFRRSCAE